MKWKQFLDRVPSMSWEEAEHVDQDKVTLLDVRQPGEYEQRHLPGAKLLPLGELEGRKQELKKDETYIIYCASGNRSRIATQMLQSWGVLKVYNLLGGIRAWGKEVAVGPGDSGLSLFTEEMMIDDALIVAFGLEEGLKEFYISMQEQVTNEETIELLNKMANFEIEHQKKLIQLYDEMTVEDSRLTKFESRVVDMLEGGLTIQEYIESYDVDINSEIDIISLALGIEAQALDLYLRAKEKSKDTQTAEFFQAIASEERHHIKVLSNYLDKRIEFA